MEAKTKMIGIFITTFFFLSRMTREVYTPTILDMYSNGKLIRHPSKRYKTRPLGGISHLLVHHSASDKIHHTAEDFARWHVTQKDWPGIGYHFVIEKDGTIVICNPIELLSYHGHPYNTKAIGICLSGNFELEELIPDQLKALDWLIKDLRTKLKPLNGGRTLKVLGHKDVRPKPTACPGKPLYNYIQRYKITN